MAHPKYAFLINPGSGSVSAQRIKQLHATIAKHKLDAEVILTGHDIEAQTARLRESGYVAVVAAGGDGTLRAVAASLVGTKTAFGVLPWGTFNHFAKDLGVPNDLEAIFTALEAGKTRQIDVGEVNGAIFLNNAALGVYPQFVADREKIQSKIGKFPAAAIASVKMMLRYHTLNLSLTIDQKPLHVRTPLVFIGNNDYQIDRLGLVAREDVDKGQLCVYTLDSDKRADMVKLAWRTGLGTAKSMDMFHQFNPTQLTVDSSRMKSLLVALDGEVERMKLPLTVKLERRQLKLIDASSK